MITSLSVFLALIYLNKKMEKKVYPGESNLVETEKNSKPNSIPKNKLSVLVAAVNIASKGEAKIVKIEKL